MASSQSGTSEGNSTGSNLSLTFNCDKCGNDVRFDRANDERYKNWIWATLCIQYTKEGVEPLAEDLVKRIHTSIKTFLEEAEQCSCKLKSLHNDGFKCKSGKCTDMKREILKYFLGRSKPNWSVGSSKRQICDSDKHFFKLLMPSRCSSCYDPSDVDCSALFELFEMTKKSPIHLDYPSNNLHKVRNARNNLMHTGTMRLQWSDLEEYGNNCLEFLEEINSTNDEFLKRKKKKSEDIRMLKENIKDRAGDLEAAENACAELQGVIEHTPNNHSSSKKRPQNEDADILESVQKSITESGSILNDISKAQQQPLSARTVFANYVKDSLLTMSRANYKKERFTINRLLSEMMEDSDDDVHGLGTAQPSVRSAYQPITSQQNRPVQQSSVSFGYGQNQTEPLNSQSMWGSQSNCYNIQEIPTQPVQQILQHNKQPSVPTRLSTSLSDASQVLSGQNMQ